MNSRSRSNQSFHAHSHSYPSSLLSGVTRFSAPQPEIGAYSDTQSNPGSVESSPSPRSPASSPGIPSNYFKSSSLSRHASVELISGAPLKSQHSTPQRAPSPSFIDRIRAHPRPWTSSPRKHTVVPEEQTESYHRTRTRVARAISPMVDLSGDITHEALVRGAELLKFSPIPGLEGAARVLLGIWDALQQIETNRLACLRLTERCADILIAIQVEISGLDKRVADVLHEPMEKLELAFQEIQLMMMSLIQQPTYRRYFKRDEVLDEIAQCGTKLQDCYSHFDRSIQLRILEFVSSAHQSPGSRTDMSQHTKEQIRASIRRVQERQNELDRSDDLVDEQNYAKTLQSPEKALKALKVEKVDIPDAMKTLLRTLESLRSTDIFDKVSTSIYSPRRSSTWPVSHADANLLLRLRDQEGLERDIRSLKAAYGRPVPTLPNWTITRFEIELGDMIGRGFFSAVYKGKWGTHVVAIKVLEVHTSKESFVNEVDVWKRLSHPNVLELYGASSAEGSFPWFLVSPLMTHGNVADHLKRIHWESQRHKESGDESSGAGSQKVDHLRMMHDIAEGMRYLHHEGIYHGDLKAANTLVADDLRCVVSDFGQSKWMSQVHQKNPLPNHALRWQAPELMGGYSLLTKKIDIYAFAMCCVEILTMGSLPWPNMNDDDVRQHVLDEEGRPPCPENLVRALGIKDLLHAAWHQSPRERPSFKKLAPDLQALRAELRLLDLVPPSPRIVISQPKSTQDLEDISPPLMFTSPVSDGSEEPVLMSPRAEYSTPFVTTLPNLDSEIEPHFDNKGNDENEAGSPLLENSLLLFEEAPSTIERDDVTVKEPYEEQFELTYRLCLSHEFPRQLNIPLWTPGDVALGDVGYLTRGGQFVKLFNSVRPGPSSAGRMKITGISSFGKVSFADRQQKDKNFVWKGFKAISKLMSTGESASDPVKRRHTFSLAGERTAFLCAEKTRHRYIEDSRPCKQWFRAHWSSIIDTYGSEHTLQKADLVLIVETLSAQDYALLANHGHSDHQAHFEILESPGSNKPWGSFVIPPDDPNTPSRLFHSKISMFRSPSQTLLVARLRFQPDVEEPTLRE